MRRGVLAVASVVVMGVVAFPAASGAQDDLTALNAKLSAAQQELDAAEADLVDAQQRLASAKREAEPTIRAAEQAQARSRTAQTRVEAIADELQAQRQVAEQEVSKAEEEYTSDKEQHDSDITSGFVSFGIALVIVAAGAVLMRFRGWEPKRWQWILGAVVIAFFAIAGIGLLVSPHELNKPEFSKETLALANAAHEDPQANPTPELKRAIQEAEPLQAKSEELSSAAKKAQAPVTAIQDEISELRNRLAEAKSNTAEISQQVDKAEAQAAEEAEFRADATTIDYDQLIKSPDEYRGTKVVYEGQIFQIQEAGGRSIILLSVTNEGYGFWTDEIWVDAGEIASAEDDVITVYGVVTGSKTYQTQIGGSRYVPRVQAKYVDE